MNATERGEEWALVDFIANTITEAQDEPHFTTAEHALMAAGEFRRGWLAEHDRAVSEKAWDEGHSWGWSDAQEAHDVRQEMARADWTLSTPNPYRITELEET